MDGERNRRAWKAPLIAALLALTVGSGVSTVVAQADRDPDERTSDEESSTSSQRQTISEDLTVQGMVEVAPPSGDATIRLSDPGGQVWEIETDLNDFAVQDVSGGVGQFPFFIEDGASTNALMVEDDGDIGIGLSNPTESIHIRRSGSLQIKLENSAAGKSWTMGVSGNGGLFFRDDNKVQLRVFSDGRIRYNPVDVAPSGSNNLGDIYNDTSGALCWYDGGAWVKLAGAGACV